MATQIEEEAIAETANAFNRIMRKVYASAASDPRQWLRSAKSLRASADLLKPIFDREASLPQSRPPKKNDTTISIGQVYLMLVGFAAENYLKGMFVTVTPAVVENDRLIHLNHHGLIQLIHAVGFEINDDERELIERLEEFVLWLGRYPVPSKYVRLVPKKKRGAVEDDMLIYSLSSDSVVATRVLDRLESELNKAMIKKTYSKP